MAVIFDRATNAWLKAHVNIQTTVTRCEQCGLFYKPELGHKCKAEKEKK